jgi:riboflavin kinase/FMN adenylyltransferase
MKLYFLPEGQSQNETVVGVGVFDGLHLAHRRLLSQVTSLAKKNGLKAGVLTFDPPPPLFFQRPDYLLITTLEEKIELFSKLKLDTAFILRFDRGISSLSPREFVRDILVSKVKAKFVVVGQNFNFGRDRTGDVRSLEALGEEFGFQVVKIPLIKLPSGEIVSSSLVRKLIQEGRITEANKLLCAPLTLRFVRQKESDLYLLKDKEKVQPAPGRYLVSVNPGKIICPVDYHSLLTLPGSQHQEIEVSFLGDEVAVKI